jgi:outer membrane immunogenic protein
MCARVIFRCGTSPVLDLVQFNYLLKGNNDMFKSQLPTLIFGIVLTSTTVFSQEDYTANKSDVTVQGLGSFVKQTTQNGITQKATNTGGVLATYRFWFDRHSGVEANYAWTPNTEKYNQFGIDDNSHEISAAYVFRMPMKRWSPFVLAGAGALVFDPKNFAAASTQTRAAFVYGGGADINLSSHLFVRGEYRGFVYNSPTYDLAGLRGFDRVTHRAEPSLGFGWRF